MSTIRLETSELDVIVIGAGIAGVNLAYSLETKAPPGTTYAILEGRGCMGGTWDLFRYPGIRTDSDVHSYSFSWNPVGIDEQLATAGEILDYMQRSTARFGIDKKILYNHKVVSMNWVSKLSHWSIEVSVGEEMRTYHARFVALGTGYYDYNTAFPADIPGLSSFAGPVVHPQFWPEKLDYPDKNVVVIGSGATAVTLVPALAKEAKLVTMLQRSPSYVYSIPSKDAVGIRLRKLLPASWAAAINRMRWILSSYFLYYLCVLLPKLARHILTKAAREQLPPSISWDPHFNPIYNPWQQRVCFCPDGDFYASLRSGRADVVTGTIKNVTATEIQLTSGEVLKPDIIITATGLKIMIGGGIKISVDSIPVDPSKKFAWQGCMLQDVPNAMLVLGYFNASFTLGTEVTAQILVRLLKAMSKKKAYYVVPRIPASKPMKEQPVSTLTSTYIKAGMSEFPKAGYGVWAPRNNYFVDMWLTKHGDIMKDLEFVGAAEGQ